MEQNNDNLPGWVGWWVSPHRKPLHSFALLAFVLAVGWLPVATDGHILWMDIWWGAGTMTLCAAWGLLAILWMYRKQMWQ